VYEGYGLSETSPMVSANRPGIVKLGTVGKPIPGVEVRLDRTKVDTDIPDAGEIVVYGQNVMQGYNKAPEETARVMTADGGFRTGDLGRFDADGFLLICGRTREQFKLQNGKWVLPAAIEENLNLSPFIQTSLVCGVNRDYTVAVINVHVDEVVHYARSRGIHTGQLDAVLSSEEIDRILKHELVQKLFARIIEEQCENCKSFEVPRNFFLTHEDWSPNSGFQTQSFKLRRSIIVSHYADEIEKLYHQPRDTSKTSAG
jgi:long-chain acyl-CoA synthetase